MKENGARTCKVAIALQIFGWLWMPVSFYSILLSSNPGDAAVVGIGLGCVGTGLFLVGIGIGIDRLHKIECHLRPSVVDLPKANSPGDVGR